MCKISFKANTISYSTITKIKPNNIEEKVIGSFVELDTKIKDDYNAIRAIAHNWDNGYSIAVDIFDNFVADKYSIHVFNTHPNRYFAIIDKDSPVDKILPESILGIAQISKKFNNTFNLDFIQTNPKHIKDARNRGFKHIGKTLINSIIKILPNKEISTCPTDNKAKAFYEKLNFKQIKNSNFMEFRI